MGRGGRGRGAGRRAGHGRRQREATDQEGSHLVRRLGQGAQPRSVHLLDPDAECRQPLAHRPLDPVGVPGALHQGEPVRMGADHLQRRPVRAQDGGVGRGPPGEGDHDAPGLGIGAHPGVLGHLARFVAEQGVVGPGLGGTERLAQAQHLEQAQAGKGLPARLLAQRGHGLGQLRPGADGRALEQRAPQPGLLGHHGDGHLPAQPRPHQGGGFGLQPQGRHELRYEMRIAREGVAVVAVAEDPVRHVRRPVEGPQRLGIAAALAVPRQVHGDHPVGLERRFGEQGLEEFLGGGAVMEQQQDRALGGPLLQIGEVHIVGRDPGHVAVVHMDLHPLLPQRLGDRRRPRMEPGLAPGLAAASAGGNQQQQAEAQGPAKAGAPAPVETRCIDHGCPGRKLHE